MPGSDSPGDVVFVSYAHEEREFVRKLTAALEAEGQRCWVDWEGIAPSEKWLDALHRAITGARAFVFVISPASAGSEICGQEAEYAAASGKRILPVVRVEVDPSELPAAIASHHWVWLRDEDDFNAGLGDLQRAIETDPDWAATHTRLLVRAREWERAGRDRSLALRGRDLARAESWLTEADPQSDPRPTPLHTDYVISSRRLRTRAQRLRVALMAVVLAVAVGLTLFALIQRNRAETRADEARSKELAARAISQRTINPELGLLLAVEANDVTRTAESEQALRDLIGEARGRATLGHHGSNVTSVASDGQGRVAVTGSADGRFRVSEIGSGRAPRTFGDPEGWINDVAISEDGSVVAAAPRKVPVTALDPATGEPVRGLAGSGDPAKTVDLSANGDILAAGGDAGITVSGGGRRRLEAFRLPSRALDLDRSGGRLASAGKDGIVRIWEIRSGVLGQTLAVNRQPGAGQSESLTAVQFSPSGRHLLTASEHGIVRIWDTHAGTVVTSLPPPSDYIYAAAFSPNGRRVVVGSLDGTATVWRLSAEGATMRPAERLTTFRAPGGGVTATAFGGNSHTVLTGEASGLGRVWSTKPLYAARVLRGHRGEVLSASFRGDERMIATGGSDGTIRLWNADTTKRIRSWKPRKGGYVWSVDFDSKGERVASATDHGAYLFGLDGQELGRFSRGVGQYVSATITDQEDHLAAAGYGVHVWDLPSEDPGPTVTGNVTLDVAFSHDGSRVATAGGGDAAQIWDADSGEPLARLEGHNATVKSVAFSTDDRRIVTSSDDKTAIIWDVESGDPLIPALRGHDASLTSAEFSPDGEQIATSSVDETVRIWDAEAGRPLQVFTGPNDDVESVSYSPGGDRLVAASRDGRAYVFQCRVCIPLDDLVDLAQAQVGAALTADEREQYLREAGIEP